MQRVSSVHAGQMEMRVLGHPRGRSLSFKTFRYLGAALAEVHPSHDQTPMSRRSVLALIRPCPVRFLHRLPCRSRSLFLAQRSDSQLPRTLPSLHFVSVTPLPRVGGTARTRVCPDHCPLSSRGWSSFSAVKGRCDRHIGLYHSGKNVYPPVFLFWVPNYRISKIYLPVSFPEGVIFQSGKKNV